MEIKKLHSHESITISEEDKILEYKISRNNDKRLILEIKFDISDSAFELSTLTREISQE